MVIKGLTLVMLGIFASWDAIFMSQNEVQWLTRKCKRRHSVSEVRITGCFYFHRKDTAAKATKLDKDIELKKTGQLQQFIRLQMWFEESVIVVYI
jgi:hypothetical protein